MATIRCARQRLGFVIRTRAPEKSGPPSCPRTRTCTRIRRTGRKEKLVGAWSLNYPWRSFEAGLATVFGSVTIIITRYNLRGRMHKQPRGHSCLSTHPPLPLCPSVRCRGNLYEWHETRMAPCWKLEASPAVARARGIRERSFLSLPWIISQKYPRNSGWLNVRAAFVGTARAQKRKRENWRNLALVDVEKFVVTNVASSTSN